MIATIFLAVVLLILVVAAIVAASRLVAGFALPLSPELRAWNAEARAVVQRQLDAGEANPFYFRYVGRDNVAETVWRVHVVDGKLRTFVAPVDRRGKRVGPSRRVLTR